ncbi:hypothetical protein HELRODRAFT_166031 [Helobdella robusta]|uniref:Uncharacterized protein n=1 Tax=Helobdella robusta TaxID=6412 RepID=T1EXM3_HELRO|nr:hypothetical protein HELRODRAFT_166031 [Helobdella robusta]ESN90371.1 hypothetical protein HELRODRAFT_166031 [Helobdella robusta]
MASINFFLFRLSNLSQGTILPRCSSNDQDHHFIIIPFQRDESCGFQLSNSICSCHTCPFWLLLALHDESKQESFLVKFLNKRINIAIKKVLSKLKIYNTEKWPYVAVRFNKIHTHSYNSKTKQLRRTLAHQPNIHYVSFLAWVRWTRFGKRPFR